MEKKIVDPRRKKAVLHVFGGTTQSLDVSDQGENDKICQMTLHCNAITKTQHPEKCCIHPTAAGKRMQLAALTI